MISKVGAKNRSKVLKLISVLAAASTWHLTVGNGYGDGPTAVNTSFDWLTTWLQFLMSVYQNLAKYRESVTCHGTWGDCRAANCYWISAFCYWNNTFVTEIFMKFLWKYWNFSKFPRCFHLKYWNLCKILQKYWNYSYLFTEVSFQRVAVLRLTGTPSGLPRSGKFQSFRENQSINQSNPVLL